MFQSFFLNKPLEGAWMVARTMCIDFINLYQPNSEAKPERPLVEALRAAFDDPATADMRVLVDGRIIHVHKVYDRLDCRA